MPISTSGLRRPTLGVVRSWRLTSSVLVLALISAVGWAEIIPAGRRIVWTPGLPLAIPDYPVSQVVTDFGAVGDGVTDDTQAFRDAIAATAEGHALLVPAGDYLITTELEIGTGIALRGQGPHRTRLLCDFAAGGSCLAIVRWSTSSWQAMSGGYQKGSRQILVGDSSPFAAGDLVELRQENDPAVYTPGYNGSFDDKAVGQMLPVVDVSTGILYLGDALRYDYQASQNPEARRVRPVAGAGIENLRIERINNDSWGSSVSIVNAAISWVRDVWSEKTLTAHIFLARSHRCEIRDSFFHDSHLHGSGGQGYGVRLEAHSADNLVENNIFERLRHSMNLQIGVSGNVYGFNYSKDPFLEEGNNWLMPDVSVHGHYPYFNLFEGNTVQMILADNVWGTNGPTTFFRNRVEKDVGHYLDGTEQFAYLEVKENNPAHNVIGNELGIPTTTSDTPILIDSSVAATVIVHGNYIVQDGTLQWDPAIPDHDLPPSYYLGRRPIWMGDLPWPPLGGDLAPNTVRIPAQQRFLDGKPVLECGGDAYLGLVDEIISTDTSYEACRSISVWSGVTVDSAAKLELRAGERVAVASGFSVGAGGRLAVIIDTSLAE
jgi:hypothetical protein